MRIDGIEPRAAELFSLFFIIYGLWAGGQPPKEKIKDFLGLALPALTRSAINHQTPGPNPMRLIGLLRS
jgi:hypothetical protein